MSQGFFLCLEGGDGSGKTTVTATLVSRLQGCGFIVCATREPSAGPVGTLA